MAIMVTIDTPGGTREFYETTARDMGTANVGATPGGIFRAAGPITGGYRIVSVWESAEAFDSFRREKLMPMLQKAGTQPSRIEIWPLDDAQTAR